MAPKRGRVLAGAGLLLLVVAPYLGTLGHGFTFDDANAILGHRGVRGPLSFDELCLRDFWGRSAFDTIGSWRPVATFAFWLFWHAGGGRPWAFHAGNLVAYAALVAVADAFLRCWCGASLSPRARWLALATFGLLALHEDVVPSPVGAAEILTATFALGALAAACGRTLDAKHVLLCAVLLALCLGSKESGMPLALLIPFLAHRHHTRSGTASPRALAALGATCALTLSAYLGVRVLRMPFWFQGATGAADNPLAALDLPHRALGALEVAAMYAMHVVLPHGLLPDYSYSAVDVGRSFAPTVVIGSVLVVSCVVLVATRWSRAPLAADAVVALGVTYLMVSHAVVPASAVLADRLFFFPSFWLVLAVALVVDRGAKRRAWRGRVALAVAVGALAQGTLAARYAVRWRDDRTLFDSALDASGSVYRTRRNFGRALAEAGRPEDAAWQLVVAASVLARFPAPIASDAYPRSWERESLAERLERLRARDGEESSCAAVRSATARLVSWGEEAAAHALQPWAWQRCPAAPQPP